MWNAEDSGQYSSRATSSKYHKRMLRLATEEEKEKLPRKQLEEEVFNSVVRKQGKESYLCKSLVAEP